MQAEEQKVGAVHRYIVEAAVELLAGKVDTDAAHDRLTRGLDGCTSTAVFRWGMLLLEAAEPDVDITALPAVGELHLCLGEGEGEVRLPWRLRANRGTL